jgi:DNA polymerase IV (archaeal DinB-like DNA polymerase)
LAARIIFHVDIDSFYPSVETRENPAIKGKPVVVGQDPKGGKGRGVVVSCSYEARKLGIHSGQPISRAYRICPEAVYLRPNFALYSKVSRSIMGVLRGFSDRFEQVSIDEAFLDVSDRVSDFDTARLLALRIKQEVEGTEGLTCSIGVAPNKSSAKIASEFQKPDGLTVVPPEELKDFLAPLPARAITGIGKKTEEYLETIGVKTVGDLQRVSGKDLVKHFGKTGVWLWGVANGLEKIEVREKQMRSLAAEHTFEKDVSDKKEAISKIEELCLKLHTRVVSSRVKFRVVGIKVRFTHFQTYTRERTLPSVTDKKEALASEARSLFREFENNPRKVRLVGVFVSDFVSSESGESLESWLKPARASAGFPLSL